MSEWRKSKRSVNNNACVEVAQDPQVVLVRDSKDPDGPVLTFGAGAWQEFLAQVKARP